ncbi:MAG: hypothetical protein DRO23_09785 [Thermoprotei archaeon]|nr:MAG: hypothetical protein DRO23_09785 [Thermoprotei archaeon]
MSTIYKTNKQVLYTKIWNAREHCCGSNPQPIPHVMREITEALGTAHILNAPQWIIDKLKQALEILRNAKSYYDQLPADNILCEILNKMESE